ncbi:MAG: alpha-hydroxy-acid oxidizing protein, partial [Rhodoferax sp.]|nr:alpha-hydroxy-acid oxidizing protein [Rhodoferax sp.]
MRAPSAKALSTSEPRRNPLSISTGMSPTAATTGASKRSGDTAQAHGADALILSNHGGRQLGGAVSPLRLLAPVVAAVGDMPV